MEWRDEAPGSVQCPNPECRITFKVDDYGTPRLRSTIICPKCGEVCRDEGWESVICPNPECQEAFEVDKYGMPIQYTVSIKCLNCGESWEDDAPGTVECPTCGKSFDVNSKGLPAVLTTIICPECEEEWQDEVPGSVQCPNRACREAFEVDKYGIPIQYTVFIKCLNCGESWEDDAPGTVECPTCGKSFDVNSKGLPAALTTIICPKCGKEWRDEVSGLVQCQNRECREVFEIDFKDNLIVQEIHEPTITKNSVEETSLQTYEVQLPRYDKTRYVQITAKDPINNQIFTAFLINISENKNGIVGTEVDKNGNVVIDNLFNEKKHIILKGNILTRYEVRINQQYGELEIPAQIKEEIIIPEKVETAPQTIKEITEKSFNNITEPINYSNLFIKINSLTLSVRTFNCLINQIKLSYIGELAQKNESELMLIRNFGRKCLHEVKHILSDYGLSLGMIVPDFDTLRYQYEQSIIIDNTENIFKADNIDRKSFLNLFIKISELYLSPRALNCMNNAKVVYVGHLVTKTEYELIKMKNMGRKSVCEIKSKLSCMGLYLGMKIPEWSQKNVEEEIKLLSDELEMHRRNNAQMFLPVVKHADFLEDELIHFVEMFSKEKNMPIIASFFGFDGKGKKTLETTGEEFHITRERVRQITEKYLKKINQLRIGKDIYLPICKNIEKYIISKLPFDADLIEMELVGEKFTKNIFKLEGIFEALNSFDKKSPFNIIKIGRKRLVISSKELKTTKKSTKLILQISKKLISSYGIANIAEIIEQVFRKTGQVLDDKYVISILSVFKNFSWLDESKGWFWLTSTSRNRMLNIIRKIFSVCESINLHELRAGIGKSYRMEGLAPTTRVLLELCKQIPWCRVEGDMITANPPIKAEDVLGNNELRMCQILKEQGPLIATVDFETICSEYGVSRGSFYQNLSYSPILNRYMSGVYGLRGACIPPGLAESIAPTRRKVFLKTDYGRTKEGDIWVIRQLAPSTIHDGRFSIPTALSQYLPESVMLKSADGTIWVSIPVQTGH
ncbi:MAG: DNA-directed RNA polymerase subunit alpha C-terminal domain-containing protein [Smithella sp.]